MDEPPAHSGISRVAVSSPLRQAETLEQLHDLIHPITRRLSRFLASPIPERASTMASRRLALNLQTALRSKAAINAVKNSRVSPLTRGLATPVAHGSKTESTTLANGFTVRRS